MDEQMIEMEFVANLDGEHVTIGEYVGCNDLHDMIKQHSDKSKTVIHEDANSFTSGMTVRCTRQLIKVFTDKIKNTSNDLCKFALGNDLDGVDDAVDTLDLYKELVMLFSSISSEINDGQIILYKAKWGQKE